MIISHQERILNIADEIVLLSNGQIEEVGDGKKILPKLLNKTKPCHKLNKTENCE